MRIDALRRRGKTKRGGVIVQVAVMSTVIFGMAALAIDVGSIYVAQAELQSLADAAALAGAFELSGSAGENIRDSAADAVEDIVTRNLANGVHGGVNPYEDVEFGRATYDSQLERFTFTPSTSSIDAIRVTARRDDTHGGSLLMGFANIFGVSKKELWASASATLVPRDIVVVIDLSNSMCYDSQLRYWDRTDGGFANVRDVWCALDDPEPDRPYLPGSSDETQYADDTGPTFGNMNQWGSSLDPSSYNASMDPGLFYVARYSSPSGAAYTTLSQSLVSRGYNSSERSALLSGSGDGSSTSYRNRMCVLLGLADWKSGKWGGFSGGDGDNYVEDYEMTNWLPYPSWRRSSWSWTGYTSYMMNSQSAHDGSTFRYRFGLKTLVSYILDVGSSYHESDILWQTPEQPVRAVKDAVKVMADFIDSLDTPDHMSLVVFATTSPLPEVYLTEDLTSVTNRLYGMQAGHYDTNTNIGGGLSRARAELKSDRARAAAKKVIVLMSDGAANVGGDGLSAYDYAVGQAEAAANEDVTIYTVSVGYGVDRNLMQKIAEIGHGQEFYAVGSPEEYTEQLENIFRSLGGKRPVVLIE